MGIEEKTLKCGFSMPVFGAGTWMVGGGRERDSGSNDLRDRQSLQDAFAAGIRHFDTAEMYAEGYAERILGEALEQYPRDQLFISSKVWPTNLRSDNLIRACERSLLRLKMDYLDLYFVHMPNPAIPMQETFAALSQLVEDGRIRYIGVSNFSRSRLNEAQQLCAHKIVATQVHYNLMFREPQHSGLLDYCLQNDIMVVAWRPVQKGLLADEQNRLLREMCERYNKTPVQIAINWLIAQQNVVTLSTMRCSRHLTENLGALGWEMNPVDVSRLSRDFSPQRSISDSVPLT